MDFEHRLDFKLSSRRRYRDALLGGKDAAQHVGFIIEEGNVSAGTLPIPKKEKKNLQKTFQMGGLSLPTFLFFCFVLNALFCTKFQCCSFLSCFTVLPIQAALGSLKASTRKTSRSRFKLFMMSVPL